jgi:hypothetical protein
MRVLRFADLHLGEETYGGVGPTNVKSTRPVDVLEVLDEAWNILGENVEVGG